MNWALILIIFIQPYTAAFPAVDRLAIDPQRKATLAQCKAAGNLLIGPLLTETNPARQFAWQDYQCVQLKGM